MLKNLHDSRIPSELEIEKISFLESLYDEMSNLMKLQPISKINQELNSSVLSID